MKVLLATDGAAHASAALVPVCAMLASGRREVEVMCVIPGHRKGHGKGEEKRLRRRADRILDQTREALAAENIEATPVVKTGSPAGVLIGASSAYDLVVAAAQSHKGDSTAGLGPVASRLAEHSRCPVLVARPPAGNAGTRILIPVDGSEAGYRTVERVARLIDLGGAEITLLHVVETPWLHEGEPEEFEDELTLEEELDGASPDVEREFERKGDDILSEAAVLLPRNTAIEEMVCRGVPADQILGEAETGGYDLIAMSASGSDDLKHQILGSVSSKVAWNAPASVLLVRG